MARLVDDGGLARPHEVRRQQEARVVRARGDGVAAAVVCHGGERLIEHRGTVQGPRPARDESLEHHERVDGRSQVAARVGADRDRHREPQGVARQRRDVEDRPAVAVLRHRRARGGQGRVLGVQDGPLLVADDLEPVRRVALLRGRRAGRDVGVVGGLRLREGQGVRRAGARLGRCGRGGTPRGGQRDRAGQCRRPEDPPVCRPCPTPSELHVKAGYRVCPLCWSRSLYCPARSVVPPLSRKLIAWQVLIPATRSRD